jgi:hypothetical protein
MFFLQEFLAAVSRMSVIDEHNIPSKLQSVSLKSNRPLFGLPISIRFN